MCVLLLGDDKVVVVGRNYEILKYVNLKRMLKLMEFMVCVM